MSDEAARTRLVRGVGTDVLQAAMMGAVELTVLPIFPFATATHPGDVLFPQMVLQSSFFEPRYLAMIEACRASNPPVFGVVSSEHAEVGTAMLLLEEEEIEGGVGVVAKTLGLRPFRVQHTWEDPDGYVRADVTWFGDGFDDADVDESSPGAVLAAKLRPLMNDYLTSQMTLHRRRWIESRFGRMPPPTASPTEFSYWCAGVLPGSLHLKEALLSIPQTAARLRRIQFVVSQALMPSTPTTPRRFDFAEIEGATIPRLSDLCLAVVVVNVDAYAPESIAMLPEDVVSGLLAASKSNSALTLPFFQRFGACTQLSFLNLARVANNDWLPIVQGLANLRTLKLDSCFPITHDALEPLFGCLSSLTALSLRRCRNVASLAGIEQLSDLRMLNVEGTRIGEEDVMLLEPLVGLTSLDLSSTVVGDAIADTLAGLTDLVELKIDATKLSDAAMPALLDMRSLSLLHLSLCTKVTDQGLSNLLTAGLPLVSLDVSMNVKVSGELLPAIAAIPTLTSLNMSLSDLDGADLSQLAALTSLQVLDLARTEVGDAAYAAIGAAVTTVRDLRLQYTHGTADGILALADLPYCTSLKVTGVDMGDMGCGYLAQMTQLTQLDIGGSRITDEGIETLVTLTRLAHLGIYDTGATPRSVAALIESTPLNYDDRMQSTLGTYLLRSSAA